MANEIDSIKEKWLDGKFEALNTRIDSLTTSVETLKVLITGDEKDVKNGGLKGKVNDHDDQIKRSFKFIKIIFALIGFNLVVSIPSLKGLVGVIIDYLVKSGLY